MQNIGHKTYNLLFIINTAELFSQTMSVNCTYMYLHEYNTGYKSMRIMSWKNQAKYYCNSLIFKTVNRQYCIRIIIVLEILIALVLELLLNQLS